jgi:two-component system, cell cycle sensor histidine kinase and response regulator CckA
MSSPIRLLLVDDSATDAKLVVQALRGAGLEVVFERVDNAEAMRASLEKGEWDAVLCDWSMPKFSAMGALSVIKEMTLDLPFILVSGTIGEESAVEAMRAGAHDYVLKDKLARLAPALEREIRDGAVRDARRRSEDALRASESHLRQAQKMEAVGRLAGGVAHDFNNVLCVILSYCSLISENLRPDEPLRGDIEEIAKAGRRAADLTKQLLLFSRQQVIETKVIDLNDVLANMDKMVRRIVGEDVEVKSTVASTVGRVRVDPSSVEQVLMNLVVNARDAMPTGGTLTMETANVTLDREYAFPEDEGPKAGPYVMLAVTDTGMGMDQATQARIFEPFFTTKEIGKGTGLGLSTVFGIVQQSGGTVRVESEPGRGSSFKVYLPRVDEKLDSEKMAIAPKTLHGTETVLLVEDEDQLRVVARGILRRCGYEVFEARNGGEALLFCQEHAGTIHLLLSDVVMPKMSGPELAKRLVKVHPEMRVLCMSGYTDDSVFRHGMVDARFPFLQKPFTPESLARKVREVLDVRGP